MLRHVKDRVSGSEFLELGADERENARETLVKQLRLVEWTRETVSAGRVGVAVV